MIQSNERRLGINANSLLYCKNNSKPDTLCQIYTHVGNCTHLENTLEATRDSAKATNSKIPDNQPVAIQSVKYEAKGINHRWPAPHCGTGHLFI
jgi:hypothetical protein